MGVVIRQSFYSIVGAYIGVAIGYVNAMFLMPLFMTPEEIGLMRSAMSIAMLMASLTGFGMAAMIIRFYPIHGHDPKSINRLFTFASVTVLTVFTALSSLLLIRSDIFFSLFEEKSPELNNYLGIIVVLILQIALFNLIEVVSRSQKEIILPNLVRELLYKVLHAVIILMYGLDLFAFRQYMIGHIVVYAILIIAVGVPVFSKYRLKPDFGLFREPDTIKTVLSFASISILTHLGMVIIVQVDQIMVTKYLGLAAGGIYSIAVFMSFVIELPRKFISQISSPIISEAMAKKDFDTVHDIYKKASINQLVIGLFIYLLIIINLDNIYLLMPNGSEYRTGWTIVVIIGLMKVLDMAFSVSGEIIGFSRYFRLNFAALIVLSFLAVLGNMYLIPAYGLNGAAIASILAYFIFNVILYLFIKVKLGFDPFTKNTLIVVLLSILAYLGVSVVPFIKNAFIDLTVRSTIFACVFLGAVYYLKVSPIINQNVDRVMNRIKNV